MKSPKCTARTRRGATRLAVGLLCAIVVSAGTAPALAATLYAGNSAGRLFTIDPATGSHTNIAFGSFSIEALAFDPSSGTLYGGNGSDRLFTIDPATGSTTNIAEGAFAIEAMTFVPEPSACALSLLGAVTLGCVVWPKKRGRQHDGELA